MHDEPTTLGGDGKWSRPKINLNEPAQLKPRPDFIHFLLHLASWACLLFAAYIVWRVIK